MKDIPGSSHAMPEWAQPHSLSSSLNRIRTVEVRYDYAFPPLFVRTAMHVSVTFPSYKKQEVLTASPKVTKQMLLIFVSD